LPHSPAGPSGHMAKELPMSHPIRQGLFHVARFRTGLATRKQTMTHTEYAQNYICTFGRGSRSPVSPPRRSASAHQIKWTQKITSVYVCKVLENTS
jgi:hypothetical protein